MNQNRVTKDALECVERTVEHYDRAWANGEFDREERRTHAANLSDVRSYMRVVNANDQLMRGIGRARSQRHIGDLTRAALAVADEIPDRESAA
jgi:hypothetical protein